MPENIKCTVTAEFSAAKRLLQYKGKCNQLHGYRQKVEVTVSAKTLNKNGISIDFYAVRELLTAWLDKNWDHNVILSAKDKRLGEAIAKITGQKIFYLDSSPSAENIAQYLLKRVMPQLLKKHKGAVCTSVKVYDNDEAWVEVKG